MTTVAGALLAIAIALTLQRWLAVAQREHYIAGSCLRTASRWLRTRPSALIGGLALIALVVTTTLLAESGPISSSLPATGLAVVGAAWPWPLSIRAARGSLRLTRRARTLLAACVVLLLAIGAAVVLALNALAGLALVLLTTPAAVDVALMATAPLERGLLERHRRSAADRLRRISPRVVAVTGSWGKTSTKTHIRDLLSGELEAVATPASWNNTAGISRAIHEHLTDSTEVFVVEMGMYRRGEISAMVGWIQPEVAVITAIGPMHLERVGSIENVVAAKSEILQGAAAAVLWISDPRLAALTETISGTRVLRAGWASETSADITVQREGDELHFSLRGDPLGACRIDVGLHPGNVACAIGAVVALGVSADRIRSNLPALTGPPHRAAQAVNERGVIVLDDTFNSNPAGAAAALDRLRQASRGNIAVVTPGMVELGKAQTGANAEFARLVGEAGATLVVVGWTNRSVLTSEATGPTICVPDRASAARWVREHLHDGDAVLWENDLPFHYP